MKFIIKEVCNHVELKQFVMFPSMLYKGNKYFVPPLISSELATLSKSKNAVFDFCESKYWLAYNENCEIVGRIAGIINHKYNRKTGKNFVRFGWLDFINNTEVLKLLFEAVEEWAKSNSGEYIHGPLGFTSFDASGVLTEGFNETPTSFAQYNYSYYSQLIEKLGFEKDAEWVEYNINVPFKVPEKFVKGTELIKERYGLKSAEIKKKKDILKYADAIFNLINNEYADLYAFTEFTTSQVEVLKKQFLPLIPLKYISVILNSKNEVIAFGAAIPSLSKALQKSKGRLFPFGYFYINNALRKNNTVDLLLIAIRKDFRKKGVNSIITNEIMSSFIKNEITNVESTRELHNNYSINNLWNKFDSRQHKRSLSYIKKL